MVKIIVTSEGCLRVEGNAVVAKEFGTNVVMFCDGGSLNEGFPSVFLDSSVCNHFKTIYVTGNVIVE